MSDKL